MYYDNHDYIIEIDSIQQRIERVVIAERKLIELLGE